MKNQFINHMIQYPNWNYTMNSYYNMAIKNQKEYAQDILRTWTVEGNMKIFEIDKLLTELFLNTKNHIGYRNCPFFRFFLECSFPINNTKIGNVIVRGISVADTHLIYQLEQKGEIGLENSKEIVKDEKRILIFIILEHPEKVDGENHFSHIVRYMDKKDSSIFKRKQIDIIDNFICNFLDFLNHPEVETKIMVWGTNEKRIGRGKLPIQDRVKVNITGKLYKYLYEDLQKQNRSSSFSYSFWVRGHYIHFRKKKHWKRLYALDLDELRNRGYQKDIHGLVSKWILPYTKGQGIIKQKSYELTSIMQKGLKKQEEFKGR